MEGYLDRPEETRAAIQDGWLDTGDLGFLHGGELYLEGRAKDVLVLRGRNHSPEEVEQALEGVSAARAGCSAAVSYLPEGGQEEVLALFVELRKGASEEERSELPEACRRKVLAACGLRAERVEVLAPGTLPRTSSGKLRRGEILKRFLGKDLRPPERVTPLSLAEHLLRSRRALRRARERGEAERAP
jgi:acyl-CoA synthetase (AMP-forming)/AMP-acid ligase II